MKTRKNTASVFSVWLRPLLIGTAVGVVGCVLLLILMAAVIRTVDIPRAAVMPLAVTAAAVGAFFAGLTAAAVTGRHGLLMGALCGVLLFLLLLTAGLVRYAAVTVGYTLLKLAVLTAVGALGGVLGVNRHRRR